MPELKPRKPHVAVAGTGQVGTGSLTLVGSGTAMASVCVVALFAIERLVGGIWSALAVATAGAICLFLAYVFARLSSVIPSGAGLLTFVSRAFSRTYGAAIVIPYLLLMMFLVGFEALIVGQLIERLSNIPMIVGGLLFVLITWVICRAGLHVGYRVQSWTTSLLLLCLVAVSVVLLIASARRGDLALRLLPSAPSPAAFLSAVGQAIFLFVGFELITSHVEVARPGAVSKALPLSVLVLFAFYALVSLGFSAAALDLAGSGGALYVPQIAIAEQVGGLPAIAAVAVICILASFTSFNGALLAMSRLLYALAAQGILPRRLATLDRRFVAGPALTALLICSIASTLAVYFLGLQQASILAAAVTAAFVYCASSLAREREPFRESSRRRRRWITWALCLALATLGIGVVVEAGKERGTLIFILAMSYGLAALAARRLALATQRTHTLRPKVGAASPGRN